MRTIFLRGLTAAAVLWALLLPASAPGQDAKPIKIGWVISKTGPHAAGAAVTLLGVYKTWIKDLNNAGGITLGAGRKAPIEVVEYDDRSNSEELVKALERLIHQDRVDFILPPWGT